MQFLMDPGETNGVTPPRGGPGLRGTLDGGGPIGTGPPPLGGLPVGGEGGLPVGGEGGLPVGGEGGLTVGGEGRLTEGG